MTAPKAIRFVQSLRVPTGALAGKRLRLAPYQRQFLRGFLAKGVSIGVLSVARGGGKSTLVSGLALGHLLGEIAPQPRRECLIGARTRDQGRICWDYCAGLALSLPDDVRKRLTFRRAPRLEIEYEADDGPHLIRVLAADGRNALGTSPSLVIADERGHWDASRGDELEHALVSGLGKRGGKMALISTSASDDQHAFSRWLDEDAPGVYRQEHRADEGCPADDLEQIRKANPGAAHGVGASIEWLQAQARRAVERGGSTLAAWRLFNLNQRVAHETRALLLSFEAWERCEVAELPPREGSVIVGIDLGGSMSMSACAFFWPSTGRLECFGAFPSNPGLAARGASDGVGGRYLEMHGRGELTVIGDRVVPAAAWLTSVAERVEGQPIAAVVADRYRQAEMIEALAAAGIRAPAVWRGQGWKDGAEDVERFRKSCFDGLVKSLPSLLLRSAFADAVTISDPAGNAKLAKGRSTGRIDAVAATILSVAQGARIAARPAPRPAKLVFV